MPSRRLRRLDASLVAPILYRYTKNYGCLNPLPTNDAYMRHELHKNLYGGLILGVNTLYSLFCFFKLFPMVGKGLIFAVQDRL